MINLLINYHKEELDDVIYEDKTEFYIQLYAQKINIIDKCEGLYFLVAKIFKSKFAQNNHQKLLPLLGLMYEKLCPFNFYSSALDYIYKCIDAGVIAIDFGYQLNLLTSTKCVQDDSCVKKYDLIKSLPLGRTFKTANFNVKARGFNDNYFESNAQQKIYEDLLAYTLNIELNRTDKNTEYSELLRIPIFFVDPEIYIKAIHKLGDLGLVRGYSWSQKGKKDSLSHVISCCYQKDDLTQEQFNHLVSKYKISNKKLLEAGMYNFAYIDYIESYLKMPGLQKAAYFFRAHMNDYFFTSEEKYILRYSDIAIEDFREGQFDKLWFTTVYEELGAEGFNKVYDAAKFITNGAKHKRAQYFVDATLGRLSLTQTRKTIFEKRNKEIVLAYGLIPIKNDVDILNRYKDLELFAKQSKQFGAQKRQSELIKSKIAMGNLARNCGYQDVEKFRYMMEVRVFDKILEFFEPKVLNDVTVYIDNSDILNASIICIKNEKKLKSIPAAYKKDEYILKLKEQLSELKSQIKRIRASLENSMINEDSFTIEEIKQLLKHPVICTFFESLVFVSKNQIGFLPSTKLRNSKNILELSDLSCSFKIAHPTDLVKANWHEFQNEILENQIKQPFKQVFRELYVMTADEIKNQGFTNRFAGYQINASKMFAILRARNWSIDGYDGFEKTNINLNLRVNLYCYADWYTSSKLESPSIEAINFFDNKTNQFAKMSSISSVYFSEILRDIDLVISQAYVGGVDPKTNSSTIQMRKAIINYNLKLFNITNYQMDENHIQIFGDLNDYSMHLGTGIIHTKAKGMLPIFPVHSQQDGHIFLPFIDEDPKTSEIMSKIILLANDATINDPSILQYIR